MDIEKDENDGFACGSIVKLVSKKVTACNRSTCDVDECSVLVFASSIASFVLLSFDGNELVEYEDENDAFAGGLIATFGVKSHYCMHWIKS